MEDGEKVIVCDAFAAHNSQGVGINDLLAEGARAEVGPLRDVENLGKRGFADHAAVDGPEATEDAEK